MPGVSVTATESVPPDQAEAVERRIAAVVRSAGERISGAQLTLRRDTLPGSARPFVADVVAFSPHGVIAAHATGTSPIEAGEALAEELTRRLDRLRSS
jgi:ribosome-associated translation inhibitor RaiA